jgi:putative transcriptional regulator
MLIVPKKIIPLQNILSAINMYRPIQIDRENLTFMGVVFPDLATLDSTANAIGSNMFEGFEPTEKLIRLYLAYKTGKIGNTQLLFHLKETL